MLKTFAVTFCVAASANAATVEKSFFGAAEKATCGQGEAACAHQQSKSKPSVKPVMLAPVKGSKESTRLPDTARVEARGGVFI